MPIIAKKDMGASTPVRNMKVRFSDLFLIPCHCITEWRESNAERRESNTERRESNTEWRESNTEGSGCGRQVRETDETTVPNVGTRRGEVGRPTQQGGEEKNVRNSVSCIFTQSEQARVRAPTLAGA